MRFLAHQLEQRHGQHDGIQHAFVHGDIAGQHLRGRAVPGHPPGQDEAATQVEQRVQAGHGHRDAQRQQRSQCLAAQQFPGRHAADQRDGKGADIGPDQVLPGIARAGPDQRHDAQQAQRAGAIQPPVERGHGVQHQQIAAQDDQVAQRRAQHPGRAARYRRWSNPPRAWRSRPPTAAATYCGRDGSGAPSRSGRRWRAASR